MKKLPTFARVKQLRNQKSAFMKKYLVSAAFVLLVGGLVAGCDKEAKEEGKTVLPDPEVTAVSEIPGIPFYGTEFELKFTSSRNWMVTDATVDGSYDYDFKYSPIAGDAGKSTIKLTFPKNHTQEELEVTLTIALLDETSSTEGAYKHTFPTFTVPAPSVTDAAGTSYKVVLLKDDNYWMAENLRYVPEGLTPSNDLNNITAGVYYPVKLASDHTKVEFTTDENDIKASGYLYQSETALGLAVNSIKTEDEAKKLEGAQGICPKGWHIPTADDIIGLVGKTVPPFELNEQAPYYDADKKNATIEKLNADGFNIFACGAVSVIDNTSTSATLIGWLKSSPDIVSSGYICGSTFATIDYKTKDNADSGIKKVQFLGIMPMANNGTANGSKLSYKIGAAVRCVMDKTDE